MDIFSIRCTAVVTTIYTELSHPHLYSFFYSQIGLDASLRLYSLLILMGYLQVRNRTRLNLRHISIGRKVYSTTWARLYCTVYTLQYCCVQHRECPSSSVLAIGSTLGSHCRHSFIPQRVALWPDCTLWSLYSISYHTPLLIRAMLILKGYTV